MLCSSPLAYCGVRCEEMGCIRGGEGMAGEGTDVLRWGKRRGGGELLTEKPLKFTSRYFSSPSSCQRENAACIALFAPCIPG